MADLSVPFHTNGTSKNLDVLGAAQRLPNVGSPPPGLSADVVGPGEASQNWSAAIATWRSQNPRPDWFDPWYWNGLAESPIWESYVNGLAAPATGSHGLWEYVASRSTSPNRLSGFARLFMDQHQSATPSPESIEAFAKSRGAAVAREFSAIYTDVLRYREAMLADPEYRARKRQAEPGWYSNDPNDASPDRALAERFVPQAGGAIDQAVHDVYTVWRAAICALRPIGGTAERIPDTSRAKLIVKIKNIERIAARNVDVEWQVLAGATAVGPAKTHVESIFQGDTVPFELEVDKPQRTVRVAVRVRGEFPNTPDAGVAAREFVVEVPEATTATVTRKPMPEIMKAALGRLGYKWKETTGLPLQRQFDRPPEAGGYLECNADACAYQLILPTHLEYNRPGKAGVDYEEIVIAASATPEEAQRAFRDEQGKDFKAGTHRGLAAASKTNDGSAGSADNGWGWGSERVMLVSGGTVIIKVTRVASCGTVAETNICGGARTVDMPTKDTDALLDEAVRGGLIPPGAVKQ